MPQELVLKPNRYKELSANLRKVEKPDNTRIDVVATVSDDSVDGDHVVVLPGGLDKTRYDKAPRIMLCHAYGRPGDYYPMPVGKALWTRREGNKIKQGIRFAKYGMGPLVADLFRDEMLNTFSIGFISEESSPPTKQEKMQNPAWAKAELVHRRWKLLEVSVVPIPSNENAIGEWVQKTGLKPKFLWSPNRRSFLMPGASGGSAPEKPKGFEEGTLVKLNTLAGGGWGRVKSLHLGTVPEADEDMTDGSEEWAAKVEILSPEGKETGHAVGALCKHVEAVEDKSYHGYPWMGEEAEKSDAYRLMANGLLDRHAKIMHSKRQGHLYANEESMEGYYVRHKSDDAEGKGYHTEEQCKSMLESAPGCKAITVSYEHPPDEDAWEMLHPAPAGSNAWMVRSIKPDDEAEEETPDDESAEGEEKGMAVCPKCGGKAMADPDKDGNMICQKCDHSFAKALDESSGGNGGYTVPPDKTGSEDDSLVEEEPTYMPKPREVVAWDRHEGMHAGAGRVKSLHKNGRIPGVYNSDVTADEKNIHAKVHLFNKADDGAYEEPDEGGHHVAVAVKHLRAMPMLRSGNKSMAKSVVPFKSGELHDGSWDAAAARARIAKWASSDGSGDKDTIDWSKYKQAFTVVDGPEDEMSSYKLPHHDVQGGKLVVSKSGVSAALGALGGARGGMKISEEEKAAAEAHLRKHQPKAETDGEKNHEEEPVLSKIPAFQTQSEWEDEVRQTLKKGKEEQDSVALMEEVLQRAFGCV